MGNATANLRGQSGVVGVATPENPWGSSVSLACVRQSEPVRGSTRTQEVHLRFGVPPGGQAVCIAKDASVRLGQGRLVLLSGPSGSGKSSALSAIEAHFEQTPLPLMKGDKPLPSPSTRGDKGGCINVQQTQFSVDCGIIDEVAPHSDLAEAASILTACGLGEASLWLRPYAALSVGEKFRARLARAISMQADGKATANGSVHLDAPFASPLLCDEFCCGLHRRAAKAIAHNLRKLVTRRGLCMVVACASDDLTCDLDPDTVVQFTSSGSCAVSERTPRTHGAPGFRRKLRIEPGLKRDYEEFAGMHYRSTDELGFVDRVYVLREGAGGDPLGIVVYSHPALELSLRNKATNGWFSRNPQRVNKHLRILRRLVIHPDVRGCGLGHYLVRKTMPLLGTEYVECLAAMGEFNPVFERAGMTRIGQYDAPPGPRAALESLRTMGIDPQSPEFAVHVARRPGVRMVVAKTVADWYAATTAEGERRVERQSPKFLARTFRGLIGVRPVYYLWRREPAASREKKSFPPGIRKQTQGIY